MDLQTQIAKLQKQAAEIKAREFDKTVQDIRAKMLAFGITAKDLQTPKSKAKGKKELTSKTRGNTGVQKAVKKPVPAKFRGPDGQTWSGRGLTPHWLAALVAQGRAKDEFAVAAEPAA